MNEEGASHLLGHEDAAAEFAAAFASGRLHHAWMLAGIEGIGKTTLAMNMAAYVLSGGATNLAKPDPMHRVAKLIAAEAHPDMLVIRRAVDEKTGEQRRQIVVDDALKISSFLRKTATHGGWRVVVVDEAHNLNRSGQNAILKILEEPPAHALIIITTTTAGLMLPTIRSRCRVMQLAPLDERHMQDLLIRQAPQLSETERGQIIALAGGSIGFAQKILRTETLPLFAELEGMLAGAGGVDVEKLHKLADSMARKADAENYEVITSLFLNKLYAGLRQEALGQGLTPALDRRLQVWEKMKATLSAADYANLDKKLAFINVVTEWRAANAR